MILCFLLMLIEKRMIGGNRKRKNAGELKKEQEELKEERERASKEQKELQKEQNELKEDQKIIGKWMRKHRIDKYIKQAL